MKYLKCALFISFLIVAISCEKDEEDLILIDETVKVLNHDDEYQIEAMSISEITYSSENEYHATVSEEGLVKAMFVGETNIVLSNDEDTKTIKIVVEPVYNLYPDPDFDFGISKASLIEKYGTPDYETESGILYDNYSSKAPTVIYLLENDTLKSSGVQVKTAYSSELGSFLSERYRLVDADEFIFINGLTVDAATMVISASLSDVSYWLVTYLPNEG